MNKDGKDRIGERYESKNQQGLVMIPREHRGGGQGFSKS